MNVKYYRCKHCGNIIEKVDDSGVLVVCCGDTMDELKAGVSDGAVEKHVPVYQLDGNRVFVTVGSVKHPMIKEHYIKWITLTTDQGIYRKVLSPDSEPEAEFHLSDGENAETVYAYCNLHGLWKS